MATASLLYLKNLVRLLSSNGLDLTELDKSVNLSGLLKSGKSRESCELISDIWTQASEYLAMPYLALEAGMNVHPADYGVKSYLWMNCHDFMEIMDYVCKFKKLLNESFSASIIKTSRGYEYIIESNSVTDDGLLVEYDFASILYMGKLVAGKLRESSVRIQEVEFAHSAKAEYERYEQCFGCRVRFDQPHNRMLLSEDVLNIPLISPRREVRDVMLKLIKDIEAKELSDCTLSQKVSNYVAGKILKGYRPTQSQVSSYLGFSDSKLKRNLRKENITYSELVSKVLQEASIRLLKDATLNIEDISTILCFSSTSAFYKFFKGFQGVTPHVYRLQQEENMKR